MSVYSGEKNGLVGWKNQGAPGSSRHHASRKNRDAALIAAGERGDGGRRMMVYRLIYGPWLEYQHRQYVPYD